MPDAAELNKWIEKLKVAPNRTSLFSMLDEFRKLDWTDEQRAAVAKLYMRLLDLLPQEDEQKAAPAPAAAAATGAAVAEEVWYEKM